jgi:hypothetical protein
VARNREGFARVLRETAGAGAPNFADVLDPDPDGPRFDALHRNELIGRPLGDRAFQDAISRRLGRVVTTGKREPKPKRQVAHS